MSGRTRPTTDWARIDAMTDDEIDTPDIPPLTEEFFKRATVRLPRHAVTVTIQVDPDVLAWFKAQGEDYEQRMQAALRIYAEAHKDLQR
ncbi:MAG: BrnA antitoxin family protein [Roseiflexus sp.]|jgi:uncharacterized protein (DUF4415 family)|uniref:BrnA antitoxin family protein n=1 Tax=Roseiflexus sp. TaxID=2562120 RepID=UPI0025FD8408|nr:BrnA antitoxin family protein [Roseiflexus sp.]MCL6540233.1 BrnA antitoxin family protein [Roseiflexus sp.]